MKRLILLLILFVNLQIVITHEDMQLFSYSTISAQHMTQEGNDNCYLEGYGWYYTTLPCEGAEVVAYNCRYCGEAFGDDELARNTHEYECGRTSVNCPVCGQSVCKKDMMDHYDNFCPSLQSYLSDLGFNSLEDMINSMNSSGGDSSGGGFSSGGNGSSGGGSSYGGSNGSGSGYPGNYIGMLPSKVRTALFAARHPTEAIAIGVNTNFYPNITSTVMNFSENLRLPNKLENEMDIADYRNTIGNAVNAVRHTLWQAAITVRYGTGIAKEAGDAHEENPNANLNTRAFYGDNAFLLADQTIDLLNNPIGRDIGNRAPWLSIRGLAYIVLEEFYQNGLYTIERTGEKSWTIVKEKLSFSDYNSAISILNTLDEDGNISEPRNGSW